MFGLISRCHLFLEVIARFERDYHTDVWHKLIESIECRDLCCQGFGLTSRRSSSATPLIVTAEKVKTPSIELVSELMNSNVTKKWPSKFAQFRRTANCAPTTLPASILSDSETNPDMLSCCSLSNCSSSSLSNTWN